MKIFYTLAIIFILSLACFGQSVNSLRAKCPNSSAYSSFTLALSGNINVIPCDNKALQFLDFNYQNPVLPTSNIVIANNNYIDKDGDGLIVNNSYYTTLYDVELNALTGGKTFSNTRSELRVKGNTPNSNIFNTYLYTDNRRETSGTTSIYGLFDSLNIESRSTAGIAASFTAVLGNFNATPIITGIFAAAGGHGGGGNYTAGDFLVTTSNDGALNPLMKGLHVRANNPSANTTTDLRGLSFDSWTNTGTVTTSYGIYADTSIDVGTNKYFIYSLSNSPSIFTGNLTTSAKFYISTPQTPSTSSATCTQGQIVWDTNFTYICVAANTWKRTALASF